MRVSPPGRPAGKPLLIHSATAPNLHYTTIAVDSSLDDLDADLEAESARLENIEELAEVPLGANPLEVGSPKLTDQVTQLLCKTLGSSKELQKELQSCGGFELIAYILLKLSPHNLSKELLQSLTQTILAKALRGTTHFSLL